MRCVSVKSGIVARPKTARVSEVVGFGRTLKMGMYHADALRPRIVPPE